MSEFAVVTAPQTVRIERLLPGPIERVWDYLTDSEKRGRWLAAGPMEPRVGGRVEFTFRHSELSPRQAPAPEKYAGAEGHRMEGRVTRWEPPSGLSYTWGEAEGRCSEVDFDLTPEGGEVRLVVTHKRLPGREVMVSVAGGWHTHLGVLIDHLSGREPEPFWTAHARVEAQYDARIPAE